MSKEFRLETEEGRLLNHALWTKDQFTGDSGEKGTPQYRIEMAFTEADAEELDNLAIEVAVAEWGEGAEEDYWDGKIRSPIKDGNEIAADRESRGKPGDAYAGMCIMRATTIYNANGEDADGGVYVADENAEPIDFANRQKVYNGCFGKAVINADAYKVSGQRGVKFYLDGFQFTRDGDRLGGGNAAAGLFRPQAAPAGESKGRKGRGRK